MFKFIYFIVVMVTCSPWSPRFLVRSVHASVLY
jgi:hypothetical protein